VTAEYLAGLIEQIECPGIDCVYRTHSCCGNRIDRINRARSVLCVIEDVEEVGAKLNFLRLCEWNVLEERNIQVSDAGKF